jgi:hypothetical protein
VAKLTLPGQKKPADLNGPITTKLNKQNIELNKGVLYENRSQFYKNQMLRKMLGLRA